MPKTFPIESEVLRGPSLLNRCRLFLFQLAAFMCFAFSAQAENSNDRSILERQFKTCDRTVLIDHGVFTHEFEASPERQSAVLDLTKSASRAGLKNQEIIEVLVEIDEPASHVAIPGARNWHTMLDASDHTPDGWRMIRKTVTPLPNGGRSETDQANADDAFDQFCFGGQGTSTATVDFKLKFFCVIATPYTAEKARIAFNFTRSAQKTGTPRKAVVRAKVHRMFFADSNAECERILRAEEAPASISPRLHKENP